MFIEVDEKELVVGKKYAIISRFSVCNYHTAIFTSRGPGLHLRFYNRKEYSGNMYNILRTIQNKNTSSNYSIFFFLFYKKKKFNERWIKS